MGFERSVVGREQVGGGYSVGMERSDVGSEKFGGRYSVCIERSDVAVTKLWGDRACLWSVVMWVVGKLAV